MIIWYIAANTTAVSIFVTSLTRMRFAATICAAKAKIVAANLIRVKFVTNMLTAVVFAAIYQIITYFFFFVIWGDGGAWYTIFLALLRSSISAAISATAMLFIFRLLSHSLSDPL